MKKDFLSIQILHGALALGALLIFLVIYLGLGLHKTGTFGDLPLAYLVPAFLVMFIFMSRFMDGKMKASIKKEGSLLEKLEKYRSRVIMRSALINGPILLTVIIMYLSGENLFVVYFVIGWLALLFSRPSVSEFSRDYHLSAQEENELTKDSLNI